MRCLHCEASNPSFICQGCNWAAYCGSSCQTDHYVQHKQICDRIRASRWFQRGMTTPDWASFRSTQDQLKNWAQVTKRDLPFSNGEQGADQYTLQTLMDAFERDQLPTGQRIFLGAGREGRVTRLLFGVLPREEVGQWTPSLVVKVIPLENTYVMNGPFGSGFVEIDFTQGVFTHLYQKRICPHVPIYYDHVVTGSNIAIATDFAHFGTLHVYLERMNTTKVLETFLIQLLITLNALQRIARNFQHNDLHAGNVFVRAYDFEGQTRYETPYGVFYAPNIGAQPVVADYGFAAAPGTVDNFKAMGPVLGKKDEMTPIMYERLPGIDVYRVVSYLAYKAKKRSAIFNKVRMFYEDRDIQLIAHLRAPKDAALWQSLPTPDDLLMLLRNDYPANATLDVKETFDTRNLLPEPFPRYYNPMRYMRVLPIERFNALLDPIYMRAPLAPLQMDLQEWHREVLQVWIDEDVIIRDGTAEQLEDYVWILYERHAPLFALDKQYHILIGYAIYVQTLMAIYTRQLPNIWFEFIEFPSPWLWAERLAFRMKRVYLWTASQEALYVWYMIK